MRFICPRPDCIAIDCIHRIPHKQNKLCHVDILTGCPQCVPYNMDEL